MRKSAYLKMFACEAISSRKPTQPSALACVGGGFLLFSVLTSVPVQLSRNCILITNEKTHQKNHHYGGLPLCKLKSNLVPRSLSV